MPAAIETGRMKPAWIAEPYFSQAVKSGKARSAGDLTAGLGLRSIQTTYAATGEYITKNREALSRFVRVVREVHEYFNTHKPEFAAATEAFTGVPRAQQAPDTVTYATDAGPRDLQTWIEAAAKYGTIPRTFNATELFVSL